jgi:tetratricopeptide (TPR) repeat protein
MKLKFIFPIIAVIANSLAAQNIPVTSKIDYLLVQGDFEKVIDTCKMMLASDSLNPEIYYKMGIAFQNIMEADSSVSNFYHAFYLNPENKAYNFMLAKGYYNKEKYKLAEPLFNKLCLMDSTNWVYAYYLTSIYMQNNRYDEAIETYKRFISKDSTNCVYLDKLGYANLKKGNFEYAISLYNKSLSINQKNISAIKNLAYLYAMTMRSDTSLQLLTQGIKIDPSDMDLYLSRANIYYSKKYTKRALDDYLVILSSGDTDKIYLKRIGIGYCNNLQPKESIPFLFKAYLLDTLDVETSSYLGQSYFKIKDIQNSIRFYKKVIDILNPVNGQLGNTYRLYAESQKSIGLYKEAITSYLHSQQISNNPDNYMTIANLYDEKLNDRTNAINYYQKYLDNLLATKYPIQPEYIEAIKKRLEYLKTNPSK